MDNWTTDRQTLLKRCEYGSKKGKKSKAKDRVRICGKWEKYEAGRNFTCARLFMEFPGILTRRRRSLAGRAWRWPRGRRLWVVAASWAEAWVAKTTRWWSKKMMRGRPGLKTKPTPVHNQASPMNARRERSDSDTREREKRG